MQTDEEKINLKQYLYDLLVVEKRTKALLEKKQEEVKDWRGKAEYARQKNEIELAEKAEQFVAEKKADIEQLETEIHELQVKIQYCKDEMKKASFTPLVDVNLLEAQFEMLLGDEVEKSELTKKIQASQVDDDLVELKKQMGLES